MAYQLTDEERAQFDAIQDRKTKQITGTQTNDFPCWKWALYGDRNAHPDPSNVFAVVNSPEWKTDTLHAAQLAELSWWTGERGWADRQHTKAQSGGKYTQDYMVRKIMKRVIAKAGLSIAPGATDYRICMHAPLKDGITYEHWWLEVQSAEQRWYTVEKIPAWHNCHIYTRVPDPQNYRTVRFHLSGLHRTHVTNIRNILKDGTLIATPANGWS